MGTPLIERISGQTFNILNQLHNRNNIIAYVENDDDIPFWNYFFSNQKVPITITTAGNNDKRGKQSVLDYSNRLSKEFILCVDSDFDYLHQGKTEQSKLIIDNQFIFHTYVHSIENYKCYSSILNKVIIDACYTTDNINFNFIGFLEKYSKIIYDIFIYFIYFEQKYNIELELYTKEKDQKQIELSEIQFNEWEITYKPIHNFPLKQGLNKIIKIADLITNEAKAEEELIKLKLIIDNKIGELPTIDTEILSKIKDDLMNLGVSSENTYLFIQGHTLLNNVVLRFLNPISRKIISDKTSGFYEQAKNEANVKKKENINNNRLHFEKLIIPIKTGLLNNKYFSECPFLEKIVEDRNNFINNNWIID